MTSLPYSRLVTSECTCRGWPSAFSRKRGAFSSGTSFSLIGMTSSPHSRLGILKFLQRLAISEQQGNRTSFLLAEIISSLHSRLVTSECTCRGWPSAYSRKRVAF
jgi:hypothetical protein